MLKPESRALLLALRRWGVVKSSTLKSILLNIFLEIELCTVRGKALFYGIILTMKNCVEKAINIVRDFGKILYTGISYLNNPPMYRIYG
ncbi:hypothetical protein QPL79_00845 [Ignisphaera sp. 4213-co]|uniref:Uncharacterized protein n=1 Tax=Ignisphaera cupida TaxID=3050454 RepID=A0ABD4Z3Y9_9CREN|nr:hypothetical protein [Ignisphaera sp. 4213-co]MDK6027914.1 hypothetical protein [Ignisphaera sp. 4213-co]